MLTSRPCHSCHDGDQQQLAESARLYAEVYAEDEELRDLTEATLEDWPQ